MPAVGYLTLLFLGTFTLFDTRVEEEARTLGATSWQVWRAVTIPLLSLFLLFPQWLVGLFAAMTALVLVTTIQRVAWAARHLRSSAPPA